MQSDSTVPSSFPNDRDLGIQLKKSQLDGDALKQERGDTLAFRLVHILSHGIERLTPASSAIRTNQ